MRNLGITGRLVGAFGLLMLIVVGLGGFGLSRIAKLDELLVAVGNTSVPAVATLGQIDAMAAKIRIAEARQIVAPTPEDAERLERLVAERSADLAELLHRYEVLIASSAEREAHAAFVQVWDEYRAVGRKVIALTRDRRYDRAEEVFGSESQAVYDTVSKRLEEMVRLNHQSVVEVGREGQAIYSAAKAMVLGTIAAAALATLVLGWLLIGTLAGPIHAITCVMSRLADNDFAVTVPAIERGDEIGRMAQAVLVFKDRLADTKRLEAEAKELEEQAAGRRKAELERFADSFETTVRVIVDSVSAAALGLQDSAGRLSDLSHRAEEQTTAAAAAAEQAAGNVRAVAGATGELASSIAEIGRKAEASTQVARSTAEQADHVDALVSSLDQAARKIGAVVNIINDIASQTNLLALNATIESARAGEAGKGFAVVAGEVKRLANQAAQATEEIAQQVAEVQGATREAVEAIASITGTIGQLSEIAHSIAAAVEEQGAATAEIAHNVHEAAAGTVEASTNMQGVSEASVETGDASRAVLEAADGLSGQAEHLKANVDEFLATVRTA